MGDCVYHAWMQHMHYLDIPPGILSWEIYTLVRRSVGNKNGFTYGGIVPVLVAALSGLYGCKVSVQYRIWTPEMYVADVKDGKSGLEDELTKYALDLIICAMIDGTFGEEADRITLEPAVYLLLNQSHAVFSETVPRGGPVMALQVYGE